MLDQQSVKLNGRSIIAGGHDSGSKTPVRVTERQSSRCRDVLLERQNRAWVPSSRPRAGSRAGDAGAARGTHLREVAEHRGQAAAGPRSRREQSPERSLAGGFPWLPFLTEHQDTPARAQAPANRVRQEGVACTSALDPGEGVCVEAFGSFPDHSLPRGVDAGEDAPARGGRGGAFGETARLVGRPPSPGRRKPHAREERGKVQRAHAGEKLFPCRECGRAFSESSSRAQQRRLHRGERPFSCAECTQSWTLAKAYLRAHMHERPCACGECGGAFRPEQVPSGVRGVRGDHANAAGVRKPSVIVWFSCVSDLRTCQMRRRPSVRPGFRMKTVEISCDGGARVRRPHGVSALHVLSPLLLSAAPECRHFYPHLELRL
ncbi:zinc finger protein 497 [Kogia breviceps]|uniref:zinc finger protein 497 n=1 Tax=Kogia breviceps TaxID=27615 RepID=UPI0034D15891